MCKRFGVARSTKFTICPACISIDMTDSPPSKLWTDMLAVICSLSPLSRV